jgi:hypothetical protein
MKLDCQMSKYPAGNCVAKLNSIGSTKAQALDLEMIERMFNHYAMPPLKIK